MRNMGIKRAFGLGFLIFGCDEPFYCDQALSCDSPDAQSTAEAGASESEESTGSDSPSDTQGHSDAGPTMPETEDASTSPAEFGAKPEVTGTQAAQPADSLVEDNAPRHDDADASVLFDGGPPSTTTADSSEVRDASVPSNLDASIDSGADASPISVDTSSETDTTETPVGSEETTTDTEAPLSNSDPVVDSGSTSSTGEATSSEPSTEESTTAPCGTACQDAGPPEEPCTDPTVCGSWGAGKSIDAQVSGDSKFPEVAVDGEGRCGILWRKGTQDWFNMFEGDETTPIGATSLPIEDGSETSPGWNDLIGLASGFDAVQTKESAWGGVHFVSGLGLDEAPSVERVDDPQSHTSRRVILDRDPSGNTLIAWDGDSQPMSNRFDVGLEGWVGVEPIGEAAGAYSLQAVATPLGGAATWMKAAENNMYEVMVASYEGDGPWETAQPLGLGYVAALQRTTEGNVGLLYTEPDLALKFANFDPLSASWSSPTSIPAASGYTAQYYNLLEKDNTGGLWMGGQVSKDGSIYIAVRHLDEMGGTWGPVEVAGGPAVDDGLVQDAAIAVDPEGHLFVAWHESHGDRNDLWTSVRSANTGEWSEPKRVSAETDGGGGVRIVATGSGQATMVWAHSMNGFYNEIWASRFQ